MMRPKGQLLFGAAALVLGLAACGSNNDRQCATGTIPDPSGADTCVPDGTVICGNGTMYDQTSGTCVATPECPTGDVLVDGTCTPNVTPNAEEAAEPNDATSAGTIMVPAVGAAGYVVHGCITPRDNGATPDIDPWQITVAGPTLLDVTANGVGGLAAGFVVAPDDPNLAALTANGWQRFGINLVDTTSHRQLYLPQAGTYNLTMSDSRQLFLGNAPAGSAQACYFTTVTQLAIPTPTAISGTSATGTIAGDVQFFGVTPTDGEVFFPDLSFNGSTTANPSLLAVVGGSYLTSAEGDGSATADPFVRFGGAKASQPITFVVDSQYNYSLAPVNFTLTLLTQSAGTLSTTGGTSTITQGDGTLDTYNDLALYWFDANAGDILNLKLGFSDDANFMIMDSNLDFVGYTGTVKQIVDDGTAPGLDDGPQTTAFDGFYHFPTAGRYYVAVFDPDLAPGGTTVMTSTISTVTRGALAVGTPVTNHALGATNGEWFDLDPTAQKWIADTASGTNIAGNLQVSYYDTATAAGLVDVDFAGTFVHAFPAAGGTTDGRITAGDPTKYLVKVSQTAAGTPNANAKFTLSVAMQTFTDLGMVDENTPVSKTGEDLGGTGKTKLYFVSGNAGDKLTILIHPTAVVFKATANWLDVDQATRATATGNIGADVTLTASVGLGKFAAFAVTGLGATTTYNVTVSATAPVNYTQAASAVTFVDACATGTDITPADNDNGITAATNMPFAFSLFGDAVTKYIASTNGWLSFSSPTDSAPQNVEIPNEGQPNGLIAPYWTDLFATQMCTVSTASTLTIEWSSLTPGFSFVETEVVLHSNGVIDFVYGPDGDQDGTEGTIGLENIYGTFGRQVGFKQTGSVAPSSSITFTPAP